jgi:arabinogalactan endo-1,4-beta-galactosidase
MVSVFSGTYSFWDVMPCNLVEVLGYIGETYCLHLQVLSVSQASNQKEADDKQNSKDRGSH